VSCFNHLSAPVLFATLTFIAACQPVPQPFSSNDPATQHPLSAPRSQAGVLVRAVTGAPHPVRLAQAVSDALTRHDIIAATDAANPASWLLTARAEAAITDASPGHRRLTIDWFLTDAQSRPIGQRRQVLTVTAPDWQTWQAGGPIFIRTIADAAATALTPLFADARAPIVAPPVLTVHDIVGAPGDGAVSLRRAIRFTLQKRGFRLSEEIADDGIVISGTVRVTPQGQAGDDVTITWTALAPDGTQLGNVEQQNRVPAGSLSGAWGVTAFHIAQAAAPGLARLLERRAAQATTATGRER
jgi:hypothetical protein